MQVWPNSVRGGHAPEVLAVGDLHLENFGTWRDTDGRLSWGINDLMRPTPPYHRSVRLAVSAKLAIKATSGIKHRVAYDAIYWLHEG